MCRTRKAGSAQEMVLETAIPRNVITQDLTEVGSYCVQGGSFHRSLQHPESIQSQKQRKRGGATGHGRLWWHNTTPKCCDLSSIYSWVKVPYVMCSAHLGSLGCESVPPTPRTQPCVHVQGQSLVESRG